MKKVSQKQLTLNTFESKLLLSNTTFDDWFNEAISSAEPRFKQFLTFLKQEFDNQKLTKKGMMHFLDLYFDPTNSTFKEKSTINARIAGGVEK